MAIEGGQGRGNNGNLARRRAFMMGAEEAQRNLAMTRTNRLDKAKIVCHERVVQIPLPHGEMLRVYGERLEEKVKHLMSVKAEELKLEDIAIVRNFSEVFPGDLSGLPPSREVNFHVNLILGAIPVVKSPYRLAPTEMDELSNQLKEL
ncbi:hypothetical protein Tco_0607871 [Tanacetum coccineum]